jgi:hypothetical protein
MKRSDGMFLECCRAVAKEHPGIEFQELIVDNTCMQLVMNPYQFDVMVMQNFYGDLVSDLCADWWAARRRPGANLGDDARRVRGDPRRRAGARGDEPREPDDAPGLGAPHAAAPRPRRARRRDHGRPRRVLREGRT